MRAVPLGPSVAIPAPLVAGLAKLARIGADEVRRRDGASVGGDLGELLGDLERIAAVPFPQAPELPISATAAISPEIGGTEGTLIDVTTAALILKLGERRTRQLAGNTLPGNRVGRQWRFDRAAVERLAAERRGA